MKFHILAATMMPALASGYSMRVYSMFGRPATAQRMGQDCSPSSQEFWREQRKRAVDRSFEELMNDVKNREDTISKSKEWIDRSFGLFSELNRDVGPTEEEVKRNEETLQKQRKWVNRVVDLAADFSRDIASNAQEKGNRVQNDNQEPDSEDSMSPRYCVKDDETTFQVEMELPGVKMVDIDIRFDEEINTLIISGQRQAIGSDRVMKFSKRFGLPDPNIHADNITATLSNGILLVAAPKKVKAEKDQAKKIPVMAGE